MRAKVVKYFGLHKFFCKKRKKYAKKNIFWHDVCNMSNKRGGKSPSAKRT